MGEGEEIPPSGTEEWLKWLKGVLIRGAVALRQGPPPRSPLEVAAHAAIGHLVEIEREVGKGEGGSPIVVANADRLRPVYYDRLRTLGALSDALVTDRDKDALYDKLNAFADASLGQPTRAANTPPMAAATATSELLISTPDAPMVPMQQSAIPPESVPRALTTVVSTAPKFSQLLHDYIAVRAAAGAEKGELDTLRLRCDTWIGVMGDRSVDQYKPRDLQTYVNAMQYWPQGVTKRNDPEMEGKSVKEILEANRDLHLKPLKRKSMEDGYVANIKTVFSHGIPDHDYTYPFANVRLRWPPIYAPSARREPLSLSVLNQAFILGVQDRVLDGAMLPLLTYLTSRRIGALCYLCGEDIRQKYGAWVARTDGIVCENGVWKRVPIKTDESTTPFVFHRTFEEIGFIDWARRQNGFVFKMIHDYANAAKQTSKNLNRLLRRAGAIGGNIEVLHSMRGDMIDEMRDRKVDPRARRLQAGHELGDEHEKYGRRALTAADCRKLRNLKLPKDLDFSVFHGLDFDALAAGRRTMGRKTKGPE
ncbi:hypothetical protein SAMN04487925_108262 [Bradyrhizobium sp. cf659]|nr:hypothetical protein SAMN04487925_108262 [Bradyrhizobium sp. cf659]